VFFSQFWKSEGEKRKKATLLFSSIASSFLSLFLTLSLSLARHLHLHLPLSLSSLLQEQQNPCQRKDSRSYKKTLQRLFQISLSFFFAFHFFHLFSLSFSFPSQRKNHLLSLFTREARRRLHRVRTTGGRLPGQPPCRRLLRGRRKGGRRGPRRGSRRGRRRGHRQTRCRGAAGGRRGRRGLRRGSPSLPASRGAWSTS